MKNDWKEKPYQGWSNYYTWNVALYLNNDYGLYMCVKDYREYAKENNLKVSYSGFISFAGLEGLNTPDGVSYISRKICRKQIVDDVLKES